MYQTCQNSFGVNYQREIYLEEGRYTGSDNHFSFNYFPKYLLIRERDIP